MNVIIGMDPHKSSATIEVVDECGRVLAVGRYDTDNAGYAQMLAAGRRFPDRVWAVEGCNGIGRHIAHRLVHDGETVLDVPAKLSAQVRVFATGNGRKSDPVDAHSVAMVALRTPNLVQVRLDAQLQVMGMLVDRRDELGRTRTQTINRLHRLLLELLPGGAKKFLSAPQARALIATVKPHDLVGKTRRRLVVELIGELERIDRTIKAADKDLKVLVLARGSTLMQLHGIGPSNAARLLADVGDIRRFADRAGSRPGMAPHRWTPRRASSNATGSPAPATAGSTRRAHHGRRPVASPHRRPRLLRREEGRREDLDGGHASPQAAAVQRGLRPHGRRPEQRASDGPAGHSGTTLQSSVTDLTPDIGSSDKLLPGPATSQPTRHPKAVLT
jgi:transposase